MFFGQEREEEREKERVARETRKHDGKKMKKKRLVYPEPLLSRNPHRGKAGSLTESDTSSSSTPRLAVVLGSLHN